MAIRPEHLLGLKVTQNMLPLLGVARFTWPAFYQGRDQEGGNHEVILGYTLWRRRFNGDAKVIGRQIKLDGEGYSVAGVMSAVFKFAPFWAVHAELWASETLGGTLYQRGGKHLEVFARLKPGVSLAPARADMATL